MNFNEEIAEELKELKLGGKLVALKEEDKGTPQDYIDLENKLAIKDMETTRMIRESARNARLGLPCGSFSVETTRCQDSNAFNKKQIREESCPIQYTKRNFLINKK